MVATWRTYIEEEERNVPEVIRSRLLHTVQAAVNMLHEDPGWFLASANFRRELDLRAVHSCNLCVLSLGLGQRLELGRKAYINFVYLRGVDSCDNYPWQEILIVFLIFYGLCPRPSGATKRP